MTELTPLAPLAAAPPVVPNALDRARAAMATLRDRVRHDVIGRDEVIELVLIALLGDGHVLLEDYPGSGKTTLAKALGSSILDDQPADAIADFRRVQFTPDLLPSDVTGVTIFDTSANTFTFRPGPVFAHVLLVDEINRTSPKVQSALLEAMAEKQVTVDNVSHRLDELFFVIATQNPLDSVGTYPLPQAQLDRFLFKLTMKHIDPASELKVLETWGKPHSPTALSKVSRNELVACRMAIRQTVAVSPLVHKCLVDVATALRDPKKTRQGVSTRSLVQAIPALQTRAVLHGRDFVTAEDIEALAFPLLGHRLEAMPGQHPESLVKEALKRGVETFARGTIS
jgi:MoxR-like ATPase